MHLLAGVLLSDQSTACALCCLPPHLHYIHYIHDMCTTRRHNEYEYGLMSIYCSHVSSDIT